MMRIDVRRVWEIKVDIIHNLSTTTMLKNRTQAERENKNKKREHKINTTKQP